jgi:molybdenum cofactor cytidylyltransferase
MNTASHVAVILAAGGSRRLGRSKQLLTASGERLLARAVRLASETAPATIHVVTGAEREAMRDALAGTAATILYNPAWPTGMASSLLVAAQALASSAAPVLVLAVDHLDLSVAHLRTLLETHALDPTRDVATGYADTFGIPAVLRASMFARAGELVGDRGFKSLWSGPEHRPEVIHAPGLLDDLDTPEDLRRAIAAGRLDDR